MKGNDMLGFFNEVQNENIELLFDGYWYSELPPIINWDNLKDSMKYVINNIRRDSYKTFAKSDDGIIVEFKGTKAPSYIHNDGIEPICFYDYKRNGAWREMQMPNLRYYFAFVYNSIISFDEVFMKIYCNQTFDEYIKNSNSYLVFNESFYVYRDYNGEPIEIDTGNFAVRNDKKSGQLSYEENYNRYMDIQSSYIYSVKVDIESFYPNIYTHLLNEIKNKEPYRKKIDADNYFNFLDYYNMKINNNQTKGIPSGVFSSTVSAELLMLCVDFEVRKIIDDQMGYLRYVDDLTFFSNSLEGIKAKLSSLQSVLNKYRLRINSSKTEENVNAISNMFVNINNIKSKFDFFDEKAKSILDKEVLMQIKTFIIELHKDDKKSDIKAFLTMLNNAIRKEQLSIDGDGKDGKFLCYYMLQLVFLEPTCASRAYIIIASVLDILKKISETNYNVVLKELENKKKLVNDSYGGSLIQIWHYYILRTFDNNFNPKTYIDELGNDINPIILCIFVQEKYDSNKVVMDYIVNTYTKSNGEKENEPNFWKNTIMFSKWWLPLFLINILDGKNYRSFFTSYNYFEEFKDIKKNIGNFDNPF